MRSIVTPLVFALLVGSLGAACAAPSARTKPCESACANPQDASCQRCLARQERAEQRRQEPPPASLPPGGGSRTPGSY
jgi:hypothetical protein